jgi:hypothetical protein
MPVVACPFCSVAVQLPDPWPFPGFTCSYCRATVALAQQPTSESQPTTQREEYDDGQFSERQEDQRERPPLSRTAYILLGLFLGLLGAHNFYAGRGGVGSCQLLLLLGCAAFPPLILLLVLWVFIDVVSVDRDGSGEYMV